MSENSLSLRVADEHDGLRLDRFLVAELPGGSRGAVRRLLARGAVRVNGRKRKKGTSVRAGESVVVDGYQQPGTWSPQPDTDLDITELHVDRDMVVVDKPSGVACHPLRPAEVGTAASALVARYPELTRIGDSLREAGLVHRLDTLTSGVLVFARRRSAYRSLVAQLRGEGEALKTYDALVTGDAMHLERIEYPLVSHGRRVAALTEFGGDEREQGRPARTEVRPRRRCAANATLVEARISAGFRHQIRAHLAAAGHPIVGDALYGKSGTGDPALERLERPFLHARTVRLRSPSTDEMLEVSAPLPLELAELLHALEETGGDGR